MVVGVWEDEMYNEDNGGWAGELCAWLECKGGRVV